MAKDQDDVRALALRDHAVRQVYSTFVNRPAHSAALGPYQASKAELRDGLEHPVPDGRYRLIGYDWVLTFRGGKFAAADPAGPTTNPAGIIMVPARVA